MLREQAGQAATLREENQRLEELLRTASERARRDSNEVLRLRGNSGRLRQAEQENARLKTENDRLAKLVVQSSAGATTEPEDEKTPEQKLWKAKARFARDIGLALRMAALDNQDRFPNEMPRTLLRLVEFYGGGSEHGLQGQQFELVYKGPLSEVREPGRAMLAREKDPVQLANGSWARAYVTVDGGGSVMTANTLEELAAREKPLLPAAPAP